MQEIIFSSQNCFEQMHLSDTIFLKYINVNTVSKKDKLNHSVGDLGGKHLQTLTINLQ